MTAWEVVRFLHVAAPGRRALSWATLASSLVVVWLGLRLAHT
jgi:hypothetical protein